MGKTSRTRKLVALLLGLVAGQLAMATGAEAQGLLGLFPPPAPPAPPAAATVPVTPLQVEQRLDGLKYDVGAVDGNVDDHTRSAIMAFQKVSHLPRTGELSAPLMTQIMSTNSPPGPLAPGGEPHRVEVSLANQVLFLYEGGALTKILPVSSGAPATPTPTGTFRIYRQGSGWRTSALGRLHNPQYFVGGYAIHGSTSIPPEPASHGCIRIPMTASEWFPSRVAKGMQVVVVAG